MCVIYMLMNRKRFFVYTIVVILGLASYWIFNPVDGDRDFSERVKISLRKVGDQLLRQHGDSTSRVFPVIEIERAKFEMTFEKALAFEPSVLVTAVDSSFQRLNLPDNYRVQVLQCEDTEIAYSYQLDEGLGHTVVHCQGRSLPAACYVVQVGFTEVERSSSYLLFLLLLIVLITIIALIDYFYFSRRGLDSGTSETTAYASLGSFRFYPEQNKLIKEAVEISLSRKESELLAIFAASPNTVVKRDELTKRVWEDNGVIVGRSLDTYISKLRKKLQGDDRIKITNVHGVGYKLEVEG